MRHYPKITRLAAPALALLLPSALKAGAGITFTPQKRSAGEERDEHCGERNSKGDATQQDLQLTLFSAHADGFAVRYFMVVAQQVQNAVNE